MEHPVLCPSAPWVCLSRCPTASAYPVSHFSNGIAQKLDWAVVKSCVPGVWQLVRNSMNDVPISVAREAPRNVASVCVCECLAGIECLSEGMTE